MSIKAIGRTDLPKIVKDILEKMPGQRAHLSDVAEAIWKEYGDHLQESGKLLYTWQYDVRWAATKLRKLGIMRAAEDSPRGIWELK